MKVDKRVEAEIDVLLARDDTASVIDALLSLPHAVDAADTDETWEKILYARLQERLARKMRKMLNENGSGGTSRNAA